MCVLIAALQPRKVNTRLVVWLPRSVSREERKGKEALAVATCRQSSPVLYLFQSVRVSLLLPYTLTEV